MSLRYAILHHTGIPSPHFDLMFETAPGSDLATWRVERWRMAPGNWRLPMPDPRSPEYKEEVRR